MRTFDTPNATQFEIVDGRPILKLKNTIRAAGRATKAAIKGERVRGSDKEWPLLLRPLKLLAKEGDVGMGDIVVRMIGKDNSKAFRKWYKASFGVDCGCANRQNYLNKRYPLSKST